MTQAAAQRAAELAARGSYGRLLATLTARTRDIAAAEDALAEAFLAALRTWPANGVPDNPDAWLMTVARNTLRNAARHRSVTEASATDLALLADEAAPDPQAIPDDRLKLLFVCAHPAIDVHMRTPLMLQTVLGLDAVKIGAAFLVPAATMGQRLVRAKAKIRDTALRFELPGPEDMATRLSDVLDAIYAAYGTAWDAVPGADGGAPELVAEALFLARLLAALLPHEPEPKGLLALMLYCEARRSARRDAAGAFVPLARQDTRLWSRDMIVEAEGLLTTASRAGVLGRFQCEAALQSVHVQRGITGRTNHAALAAVYALLVAHFPSVGARVAQAGAWLEAGEAPAALAALSAIADGNVRTYQPYWVVRARVLHALGQDAEGEAALQTALALTADPAVRHFLAAARPG